MIQNFVNNRIQPMYLGNKGYSIPKNILSDEELKGIKRDLTFQASNQFQSGSSIPVYRESTLKLYVPRFYGEKKYGKVTSQLNPGKDVSIPFTGSLRDIQLPIVRAYLSCAEKRGCGLLELPCGFGKTIIALHIASKLGKKTLVVVHKEFLLEQWKERIAEFLPSAKVGRIQGNVIDTADKDIVIGMLQSLSMKDYHKDVFDDFGFTIIDETHHIAAEAFSNSLFKIVTPYMLGLSATMTRKDGMTKVFKLFLGEVEFKAHREKTNVTVHAIQFNSVDAKYNEPIVNFKGQTHYTLMINKIAEYAPRVDFIARVLTDLLLDARNQQIMILSHTKQLLHALHAMVVHLELATVGYYVGGMKAADLKDTENKRIVLATYAMAEEALDIKTLTTLIMATPKTNVTQSIGRILREAHERPLVVDIVDTHDMFTSQWKKRKTYYNQQQYRVQFCNSTTYPEFREITPVKKCRLNMSKLKT